MSKHTPGPWEWWTSNSWRRLRHSDRGVSTNILLPVVGSGHPDLVVSRADMALIAAAPDLYEAAWRLEAAESARTRCLACNDEGEPEACKYCFPRFDHARCLRRAAIAKAEGRAPVLSSAQGRDE